MKLLDGHKTNLSRLVSEGLMISKEEPEALMNSKSEWGRGKTIRFTPTVTNTLANLKLILEQIINTWIINFILVLKS